MIFSIKRISLEKLMAAIPAVNPTWAKRLAAIRAAPGSLDQFRAGERAEHAIWRVRLSAVRAVNWIIRYRFVINMTGSGFFNRQACRYGSGKRIGIFWLDWETVEGRPVLRELNFCSHMA